ncbi:PD-(D/E)XK nuclease family protein [bacterium]|nr:PD-(D/E)XK nuclease family protein [bacterium]
MSHPEIKNVKNLLERAESITERHDEIQILKGERFNLFSILQMERLENRTHSAFIAEMLSREGSHGLGSVFLKLFVGLIGDINIDVDTSKVHVEYHIGTVNVQTGTGGRIDIFITDSLGNAISIENKIDAGDQEQQLVRYHNYMKGSNQVYYLNLFGSAPSDESVIDKNQNKLEPGKDFSIISYKSEIVDWLELCIKECYDLPVVRESIKQYLVLIKRMTSTMNNELENELMNEMLQHFEAASYIADNFPLIQQRMGENIRQKVIEKLKSELKDYIIDKGADTSRTYSQIWVKHKSNDSLSACFGIESFSGRGNFNGDLFIGLYSEGGRDNGFIVDEELNQHGGSWVDHYKFSDFTGKVLNLSKRAILQFAIQGDKSIAEIAEHIAAESKEYIQKKESILLAFINHKRNLTSSSS